MRVSAKDALTHSFFDDKYHFLLQEEVNINKGSDIKLLMKVLFVFIIVLEDREEVYSAFNDYVKDNSIDRYQERFNDYIKKNLICYDGNSINNIIDYLVNNKIFAFQDNIKKVFNFVAINAKTITIGELIDNIKDYTENNELDTKFYESVLQNEIGIEEFTVFINEYLLN